MSWQLNIVSNNIRQLAQMSEVKQDPIREENIISCLSTVEEHQVRSQHFDDYSLEMTIIKKAVEEQKIDFGNLGIRYNPARHQCFTFRKIDCISNSQGAAVLEVQLGGFTLNVKVYFSDRNTPLEKAESLREGSFGFVYCLTLQNKEIMIKATELTIKMSNAKRRQTFKRVLRQFCISKICDILKCGPALPIVFGFDILFFRNSIEFAMERCELLKNFDEGDYQELLKNLGILHSYLIIHKDISPSNIMFSKTHGKLIFIDFGLSQIISEECGYKSYTSFSGTPRFVSKEMLKLFSVEVSHGWVDLYYNDLECLRNSILAIRQICNRRALTPVIFQYKLKTLDKIIKDLDSKDSPSPDMTYNFIVFVHACYFNSDRAASVYLRYRKSFYQHFHKKTLDFMASLPQSLLQQLIFDHSPIIFLENQQLREILSKKTYLNFCSQEEKSLVGPEEFFSMSEIPSQQENYLNQKASVLQNLKKQQFFKALTDKTVYFDLLFNCLRFDVKNFDSATKRQLAAKFLEIVDRSGQIDPSSGLSGFKAVFKYLLEYCLSEPSSGWKKEKRFDVLLQSIMTDADIVNELQAIELAVDGLQSFEQLFNQFSQFFYLDKFLEKKILFDDHAMGLKIISLTKRIFFKVGSKLSENRVSFQEQEQTLINVILEMSQGMKISRMLNSDLYSELIEVKDSFYRQTLKVIWLIQHHWSLIRLRIKSQRDKSKAALQFLQSLNSFDNFKTVKWSFIHKIQWNILLVNFSATQISEMELFANFVGEIINNQQIFAKLYLKCYFINDKSRQLFQEKTVFQQYLREMIRSCFQDHRFQVFEIIFTTMLTTLYKFLQSFPKLIKDYVPVCSQITKGFYLYIQDNLQMFVQHSLSAAVTLPEVLEGDLEFKLPPFPLRAIFIYYSSLFISINTPDDLYRQKISDLIKKLRISSLSKYVRTMKDQHLDDFYFLGGWWISIQNSDQLSLSESLSIFKKFNARAKENHNLNIYNTKIITLCNRFQMKGFLTKQEQLFQSELKRMLLWANKEVMAFDLEKEIYLEIFPSAFFGIILKLLAEDQQDTVIYQLLHKIVERMDKPFFKTNQYIFSKQMEIFRVNNPLFFKIERVQRVFGEITWNNRFALIFYSFALSSNSQVDIKKKVLVLIAKNIYRLNKEPKYTILGPYFFYILFSSEFGVVTNDRKRLFAIFRCWNRNFHNIAPVNRYLKNLRKRRILGLDRKNQKRGKPLKKLSQKLSLIYDNIRIDS